ncbi:MAG: hypothetical protein NTW21_35810 [Verrucomicrobia bacterium]|nr:hypothetical protein [Verrucomicrobiota bacterium]
MKSQHVAAVSAALIALSALAASASPTTIPAIPQGTLSAFPTIVQTGTKPTLTWSILYPSTVSDLAVVSPPGTITPTEDVYVTVQPVGTNPSTCDPTQGTTPLYTDARVSLNGGPFLQIFYGTQADVDPAKPLYIKKVLANQTLDFGGRFVRYGEWSPFYTTKSANFQVVALVNGATPPTTFPLHQSSALASYLRPYLDASGKVHIGPLSILILMELGQTNHGSSCFDYQDQVLLVTLSKKHPNNGHGNNLDGVDCSNPGKGHGGPNGEIDLSGGIDDERK